MNITTLPVDTNNSQELVVITERIQAIVASSNIVHGICFIYCPHTTAAITVNSYLDPATALDLRGEIDRLVPIRSDFYHFVDTPLDAAAHIKSSLIGGSLLLIINDGQLVLGDSQGVFFWEFDGPRNRKLYVKLIQG